MEPLIIGIVLVVVIIAALVAYGVTTRGGEDDLSEDVELVDDPELTDPETEIDDADIDDAKIVEEVEETEEVVAEAESDGSGDSKS